MGDWLWSCLGILDGSDWYGHLNFVHCHDLIWVTRNNRCHKVDNNNNKILHGGKKYGCYNKFSIKVSFLISLSYYRQSLVKIGIYSFTLFDG